MESHAPLSVNEWLDQAIRFLRGECCVDEACVEGVLIVRCSETPSLRNTSTDIEGDDT